MSIEKSNLFGSKNYDNEFLGLVKESKSTYLDELNKSGESITVSLQEVITVVQKYCEMSDSLIKVPTEIKVPTLVSFRRLYHQLILLSFEVELMADIIADSAVKSVNHETKLELLQHAFCVLKELHIQMRENNKESVKYLDAVIKEIQHIIIEFQVFIDSVDLKNKIRGNYQVLRNSTDIKNSIRRN